MSCLPHDVAGSQSRRSTSIRKSTSHSVTEGEPLEVGLHNIFARAEREAHSLVAATLATRLDAALQATTHKQSFCDVALRDRAASMCASSASLVTLNVSGAMFQVSRAVLTCIPHTVFCALLSEGFPVDVDEHMAIVIDRSRDMFALLVEYLKLVHRNIRAMQSVDGAASGVVHGTAHDVQRLLLRLSFPELALLREEACFFGLTELESHIASCTRRRLLLQFPLHASTMSTQILDLRSEVFLLSPAVGSSLAAPKIVCVDVSRISVQQHYVVCGASDGFVHVTQVLENGAFPGGIDACSLSCHGNDAVTGVAWVPKLAAANRDTQQQGNSFFVSVGRDGYVSIATVHSAVLTGGDQIVAKRLHRVLCPDGVDAPSTVTVLVDKRSGGSTRSVRAVHCVVGHVDGSLSLWRAALGENCAEVEPSRLFCFVAVVHRDVAAFQNSTGGTRQVLCWYASLQRQASAAAQDGAMLLAAVGQTVHRLRIGTTNSLESGTRVDMSLLLFGEPLDAHLENIRCFDASDYFLVTACFGGRLLAWRRDDCVSQRVVTPAAAVTVRDDAEHCAPSSSTSSAQWFAQLRFVPQVPEVFCASRGTRLTVWSVRQHAFVDGDVGDCVQKRASLQMLRVVETPHTDIVRCFCFVGWCGLLTGSYDGTVRVWDEASLLSAGEMCSSCYADTASPS